MTYIYRYASPMGRITLASDANSITGLWFDGQKNFSETIHGDCEERSLPVFDEAVRWLDVYFSGRTPGNIPPIYIDTTPFRKDVWEILLTIPYGQTMTYGEIADRLAVQRGLAKMSAQAVGGAVGHNPIAIIIPCHRVVGARGELTGYAGGIERKKQLLTLENAYMPMRTDP